MEITTAGHIALEIHPDGGPLGASAREAHHNAAAILQKDAQALTLGHRLVHRVGVTEIVGPSDGATGEGLTDQTGQEAFESVIQAMGGVGGHCFVVMT